MAKISDIKPGDLVKVYSKIREGEKERVTLFQGVVMQIRGAAQSKTFTVRKISAGIGVERIFPFHSPMITKIEIKKKGKVRRAKLNYLRQRKGRKMKIKEVVEKTLQAGQEKLDKVSKTEITESLVKATGKAAAEKSREQEKKATKPSDKKKQKEPKKPKEPKSESAPGQKTVEKT